MSDIVTFETVGINNYRNDADARAAVAAGMNKDEFIRHLLSRKRELTGQLLKKAMTEMPEYVVKTT